MAKGKTKGKTTITVDFEGVETRRLIPESDYKATPVEATIETGSDSGKKYIAWTFEIIEGKFKGQKPKAYNTSLQPQTLWNLRGLLEALGQEVPEGAMDIDLKEIIDSEPECVITIEHDTYEGRKQANIVDISHIDNWDGSGGGEGGNEPEVSEEDIMAMDEDELKEFCEANDLEVKLKGKLKDQRKAVVEAWEEHNAGGEGGDGDELPDEDAVNEMDEDDLEACVKEHELEVDLDDHSTLKKKRKAVIEAIEEKQSGGEGGDGGGEGEKVTEDAINEMGKDELKEFCEANDIDTDILEGSTSKQRRAVIKAAKKADLIEE